MDCSDARQSIHGPHAERSFQFSISPRYLVWSPAPRMPLSAAEHHRMRVDIQIHDTMHINMDRQ